MNRLRHKLFVYLMRGLDPVILFGIVVLLVVWFDPDQTPRSLKEVFADAYRPQDGLGILALALGWLIIFHRWVHSDPDRFTTLKAELIGVVKAASASALWLLAVSAAFSFGRVDKEAVLLFWVGSTGLVAASRVAARGFLKVARRSGYNYRHLLVIGTNARALDMARRIERLPELGYKIVGFVSENPERARGPGQLLGHPVVGGLAHVQSILERGPVDEMIICLPVREHVNELFGMIGLAQELGIVARLFPDEAGMKILTRMRLERFEGDDVVTLFREQLVLQLLGKRLMDVTISLVGLALLSPLWLVVAMAIKLTSPGPVFFVQKRVGMNKRTFNLYKFRSMCVDAEERRQALTDLNEVDGPVFKMKSDPRVTPVGRIIRKTSIDELPQLINVLRGHMSLVGPRPPLPSEVDHYEWLFRKRLSIKPGITCLWQVSGRNQLSFREWMELDWRYVTNWSLWLDLKILLRTIPVVLGRRGAS